MGMELLKVVCWMCWYLEALIMSTPPGSGSEFQIVVKAPINVFLPTYDWNALDQMREF